MPRETASQSMERQLHEMHRHVEEIQELYAALREKQAAGEAVNWGHVGDVAHYNEVLRQITDQVHKRGEYAE